MLVAGVQTSHSGYQTWFTHQLLDAFDFTNIAATVAASFSEFWKVEPHLQLLSVIQQAAEVMQSRSPSWNRVSQHNSDPVFLDPCCQMYQFWPLTTTSPLGQSVLNPGPQLSAFIKVEGVLGEISSVNLRLDKQMDSVFDWRPQRHMTPAGFAQLQATCSTEM